MPAEQYDVENPSPLLFRLGDTRLSLVVACAVYPAYAHARSSPVDLAHWLCDFLHRYLILCA
jgi:hypothetical protein